MAKDPWTDPDPQPGDFDADLALLDESAIDFHDGDPSAALRVVVSIEGEDASRLVRIAEGRGGWGVGRGATKNETERRRRNPLRGRGPSGRVGDPGFSFEGPARARVGA